MRANAECGWRNAECRDCSWAIALAVGAVRAVDVVEQRERGQGDDEEHERGEREVGDFAAAAGGRVDEAEDFGGDEPERASRRG